MTTTPLHNTVVIIGGGAAGFFAAITCAEAAPHTHVILLEKTRQVLSKVKISGGGRCNVTHACFDPAELVKFYPRGSRELRGPFSFFQPKDTIAWFEGRGVKLKVEEDGRMFPVSDDSQTIISALMGAASNAGVELRRECGLESVAKEGDKFLLTLTTGETLTADKILFATGSQSKMWELIKNLGHTIVPSVPSLFTFNIPDSPFHDLSGVSVPDAIVTLPKWKMQHRGPVLITHWGVSGPAVLKLSAWAARELHQCDYVADVKINWAPNGQASEAFAEAKRCTPTKFVHTEALFDLPKKLWKRMVSLAGIDESVRWSHVSKEQLNNLTKWIHETALPMRGKTTNKEEFVTAGGVKLSEVNFKTMESKVVPGVYFAGEVLDVDGITGGFNFQNAWTTGRIAGLSLSL
jgi:hypothetical protein